MPVDDKLLELGLKVDGNLSNLDTMGLLLTSHMGMYYLLVLH
jgi:hypothetical protein